MNKIVLALFAGWLLAAAAPAKDARALMEQGKEAEAFALIERATAQGDADATDYLAWFYDTGTHVAADADKAGALYRKAAELGVPHAQWRLGVMIDTGEDGASGTAEEAVALFERAAAQGFSNAWVSLGVMQSGGRGTAQDYTAAMASFRKAATFGNVHAFNEIGVMHARGEGVPVDYQEALAWFFVAALRGDEAAGRFLESAFEGIDTDLAEGERRMREIEAEFGLEPANVRFEDASGEGDAV